ncbi:Hypothetical predicted protein [Octopus vulgaris]|uniref:Uncharacterized protein n=1 Tax=Octopus vulgaris TaxID=6645 RepID=A0AA36FCC2_OCTVU|nr:Hypothetical predicted protein [Octopus vulgaris]
MSDKLLGDISSNFTFQFQILPRLTLPFIILGLVISTNFHPSSKIAGLVPKLEIIIIKAPVEQYPITLEITGQMPNLERIILLIFIYFRFYFKIFFSWFFSYEGPSLNYCLVRRHLQ